MKESTSDAEATGDTDKSHRMPVVFGYDEELGLGRYVQVRNDFVLYAGLTPATKILYIALCCYASVGAHAWPSHTKLAKACGVREEIVEEGLQTLMEAGLLTIKHRGTDNESAYLLNKLPDVLPMTETERATTFNQLDKSLHIPQEHHPTRIKQIQNDTELLINKVGISKAAARSLAKLAAERGCSKGYVAEIIEYALTTPGINNPSGCIVELIKRNEVRKPALRLQSQDGPQALDAEKYTKGKYAFLFRPFSEPNGTQRDEQEESHEQLGRGAADTRAVRDEQL